MFGLSKRPHQIRIRTSQPMRKLNFAIGADANTKNLFSRKSASAKMKTVYLDIFSGISGDMFLGAMIDLGVDAHALEHELERLKLDGWRLHVGRGQKMGISGTKFDVHLAHEHTHE